MQHTLVIQSATPPCKSNNRLLLFPCLAVLLCAVTYCKTGESGGEATHELTCPETESKDCHHANLIKNIAQYMFK